MKIESVEDARKAAERIAGMGAENVLLKGGHLKEDKAVDILFSRGDFRIFESERVDSENTHGTGCTLSAAIAACLARGDNLAVAAGKAKRYITMAIKSAPRIGKGCGPLYHKINPEAG